MKKIILIVCFLNTLIYANGSAVNFIKKYNDIKENIYPVNSLKLHVRTQILSALILNKTMIFEAHSQWTS